MTMVDNYVLTEKQSDIYDSIVKDTEDGTPVRADNYDAESTVNALIKSGLIWSETIRGIQFVGKYAITESKLAEIASQIEPESKTDNENNENEVEDNEVETSEVENKNKEVKDNEDDDESVEIDFNESFFEQFSGIGSKTASKIVEKAISMGVKSKKDLLDIDLTELPRIAESRAETIKKHLKSDLNSLKESVDKLKRLRGSNESN